MKKFYSLVLMAAALLIGTNAWAVYPAGWLQAQFDAIQADGQTHTITMEDDILLTDPVYLGTATVDEARKSIILDMNGHHITMNATNWVSSTASKDAKGNDVYVFCSVFNITHGELVIKNSQKSTTTSLIQFTGTAYGKYNDIFNVAGSYKSSRWVKNNNGVYEISESAAKNTRDANGGWFTHLIIDEGVKLYAPNTVFGAGISIDGYYTLFHGQVSATASLDSVFGKTSLKGTNDNLCLTNRADAPRYNTAIMTEKSGGKGEGFAYGVRVEVYGDIEFASDATNASGGKSYGIKLNGGLRSTLKTGDYFHPDYCKNMDEAYVATYGATAVTQTNLVIDSVGTYRDHYFNHRRDTIDAPFLYIGKTAHIIASAELNEATAIYCSGYGKTLIEGACSGNSGVNIKSGTVEIHDAEIICTATESTTFLSTNGNNATGSGGVVVNSVDGRAGGIEVTISGDSKVSTDYGYAIVETVTANNDGTKVSTITIDGGTIQGGAPTAATGGGGAIIVSEDTQNNPNADVVVYGTNLTGNTEVQAGTAGTLDDLLPQTGAVITEVIVDGKPTIVVSEVEGTVVPVDEDPVDSELSIMNATGGVKWTGTVDQIINGNKTLDYLEMNLTTGTSPKIPVAQKLTIQAGDTLSVGRVVLGEAAKIIVEAGATFIITGEQGIVAPVDANIVLMTSQTAQASFIFNPEVASNRHPRATVKMLAEHIGRDNVNDYYWHRFAIPTNEPMTSWDKEGSLDGTTYPTYIYGWNYANNDWENLSGVSAMKPMLGYTLTLASEYIDGTAPDGHLNVLQDVTYVCKGEMVGNVDKGLVFAAEGYNFFGNSYTGYMDVLKMIEGIADPHVDGTVYMWDNDNQIYTGISLHKLQTGRGETWEKEVAPMQTFILRLRGANEADESINYENAIWYNPRYKQVKKANPAPRRQQTIANDETYMEIVVKSANGKGDKVDFAENANNSDAFESGYDVEKFMNERSINLYSTIDGDNYSSVVTDNLDGKMLSLKTNNEMAYTMSFKNVEGNEYAIRDNVTGSVFAIAEGATYEFAAQPNSVVEGRFEIINVNKMPTAIDNTEVKSNVKGIYTITGQYVGENFNALPAGVYVVDGVKIVK